MSSPFGDRVRAAREAQGFGLNEAARKCEIAPQKLADAEAGVDSRASTVAAIARGLGVSADYLLGLSEVSAPGLPEHPESVEDLLTLQALSALGRGTSEWLVALVDALRSRGIDLPDLPPPPGTS